MTRAIDVIVFDLMCQLFSTGTYREVKNAETKLAEALQEVRNDALDEALKVVESYVKMNVDAGKDDVSLAAAASFTLLANDVAKLKKSVT